MFNILSLLFSFYPMMNEKIKWYDTNKQQPINPPSSPLPVKKSISNTSWESSALTTEGMNLTPTSNVSYLTPVSNNIMSDQMFSTRHSTFDTHFQRINKELPFNQLWYDNNGDLRNMVEDPMVNVVIKPGKMGKCVDSKSRPIIVIGTHLGPVVVFKRFGNDMEELIIHSSFSLTGYMGFRSQNRLEAMEIDTILGSIDGNVLNIGKKIASMYAKLETRNKA